MLKELLKYDRLGSKEELLFLLFNALPLSNGQKITGLRKYCTSNHFSISRSFEGTLKLLEFIAFINVSDGIVSINDQLFDPDGIKDRETYFEQSDFIKDLFLSLKRENAIGDFIRPDALRLDPIRGLFYLKESLIPFQFFGLRNLLISVGLLWRDPTLRSSNLFVNGSSTELFKTLVVDSLDANNRLLKRKLSLDELKVQLERLEEFGTEAELFVLAFEKHRLQAHPSIGRIQRVSDNHVNAGYDIESFNDTESIFLDRFIEVKSYAENAVFYWSQNEIETAKELAQKYFLYLVDRNKMLQSNYVPRMFQNPYQKIFENEFWEKTPEAWKVSAPRENHN